MRALQLTAWQSPPELREVPDPSPGPGQVLVKVGGSGACHSDLHLLHDFTEDTARFSPPFTLGHENAGWVEGLGEGVTGLEVGQPVAIYGAWGCGSCPRCSAGLENYCERREALGIDLPGLGADGGMAPLLVVPSARHLVPLGGLDVVDAAPLTDAALTPYHAVRRSLDVLVPGSTAVVVGAGGLGHLAIQVLQALTPARIVAVDRSEEALRLAAEVGADRTVLSSDDSAKDPTEEVRGHTANGRGADLVLDLVGAEATVGLAVAVARPLGHVTVVGIAGGSYPFSFFTVPYEVSMATTFWGSLPELGEVLALAESGQLRAHVERFDLDSAATAYGRLEAGTLRGRAVIVPT